MYPHYVDENNNETNVNNIDNLETTIAECNDTKCYVDNIEQWSSVYEIGNYTPKVIVSKG